MATINLASVSLFFSPHKQLSYLVARLMTPRWSHRSHRSSILLVVTRLFRYRCNWFSRQRFDDTNTRRLIKEMSINDSKMLEFDVEGIDWELYFVNDHLPGLKRHLINGSSGVS